MVDAETLLSEHKDGRAPEPGAQPVETVTRPTTPLRICACSLCEDQIYRHAVKPKFTEYSRFSPFNVEELTEHQYFICFDEVQAFVFKFRKWGELQVSAQ